MQIFGADIFPGLFLKASLEKEEAEDLVVINAAAGVDLSAAFDSLKAAQEPLNVVIITQPDSPALPDMSALARHKVATLRCPYLIGTHMTGLWRTAVNAIYRGYYYHLLGNQTHCSIMHARDLGRAIMAVNGCCGEFYLSDGTNPLFEDVIEALSWRLDRKRIPSLTPQKWRWMLRLARFFDFSNTAALMQAQTTDNIVDTSAWTQKFPDFEFTNVITYLTTHKYEPEDV